MKKKDKIFRFLPEHGANSTVAFECIDVRNVVVIQFKIEYFRIFFNA